MKILGIDVTPLILPVAEIYGGAAGTLGVGIAAKSTVSDTNVSCATDRGAAWVTSSA